MPRGEDLERRIRTIVARLGRHENVDALPDDADLYRQLGIASSAALELLLGIEDELGVQLADAEFNEARTIRALCALVARGGASS
jgi:acyl carrier protein